MKKAFIIEVVFASWTVIVRTGVGIAAVVVICVGFLVFIIVLGIIRIRTVHQRSVEVNVEEKQEMEWDNSALTITVNPMDSEVSFSRACRVQRHMLSLVLLSSLWVSHTGSASDWCALQEVLCKCIDTI